MTTTPPAPPADSGATATDSPPVDGPPARVDLETPGVPTGTRAAWVAAAAAVLRKAGKLPSDQAATDQQVLALLARQTADGLVIPPLGTAVPAAAIPDSRRSTTTTQGWDIRVEVADSDPAQARAALLADLEGGANSGWLRVGTGGIGSDQIAAVLEPVLLDIAPIVLDVRDADPADAYAAFAGVYAAANLTPAPGTSLGADPLGAALRAASTDLVHLDCAAIASRATDLGIGAIVVDGTAAHQAGATDAAEIGWALAAGAAYLRALTDTGLSIDAAAALIDFRFAVTAEQFTSIAKLRAARQAWARVLQVCGATDTSMRQHAVTSAPMTTRYDPWVNMLRTTIAAFAAGAAGAQAVSVTPFDAALGIPDAFGRRIARNVSHLLIGESHVAAVADPAGGAGAIEQLTDQMADAGWAEFAAIEQAGGAAAALADGSVVSRIDQARQRRTEAIATRRQPLTGVSEFPHLAEELPTRRPSTDPTSSTHRWAAAFESLREHPPVGAVFLATLGPVATHSTRAGFAAHALAAGGVATVSAGATASVDEVVAAYRQHDCPPVVCLVGTDSDYVATGCATIVALRQAGARTVLLAGKPIAELADLIDDRIAVGDDVVALSHRVRHHLEGASA